MDWLRRIGCTPTPPHAAATTDETAFGPVERATPGVAALLDGVLEDRSHAVLDLGAAANPSLRVYRRFAQRIRFADLLADRTSRQGWATVLSALPPQPERPYDLVFAWDLLDRLLPEERPRLVQRLAEVSATDARLHVVVEAPERATTYPVRFALLDVDRMSCEPTGPARPARRRLLPTEVERLLAPFHVARGFTLKGGLREYVAVRGA